MSNTVGVLGPWLAALVLAFGWLAAVVVDRRAEPFARRAARRHEVPDDDSRELWEVP